MERLIEVTTIDEEFEKARIPGAKDVKKRRKRGLTWSKIGGGPPKTERFTPKSPEFGRSAYERRMKRKHHGFIHPPI